MHAARYNAVIFLLQKISSPFFCSIFFFSVFLLKSAYSGPKSGWNELKRADSFENHIEKCKYKPINTAIVVLISDNFSHWSLRMSSKRCYKIPFLIVLSNNKKLIKMKKKSARSKTRTFFLFCQKKNDWVAQKVCFDSCTFFYNTYNLKYKDEKQSPVNIN